VHNTSAISPVNQDHHKSDILEANIAGKLFQIVWRRYFCDFWFCA